MTPEEIRRRLPGAPEEAIKQLIALDKHHRDDVNPLDFDLKREDGADAAARRRAIELRARLDRELICWFRRGPRGDLAVVGLDDAAARSSPATPPAA